MNNHNTHDHNKQRQDECPFSYVPKIALLYQQDRNIDTVQQEFAASAR